MATTIRHAFAASFEHDRPGFNRRVTPWWLAPLPFDWAEPVDMALFIDVCSGRP